MPFISPALLFSPFQISRPAYFVDVIECKVGDDGRVGYNLINNLRPSACAKTALAEVESPEGILVSLNQVDDISFIRIDTFEAQ
jgi:hypothetical protein